MHVQQHACSWRGRTPSQIWQLEDMTQMCYLQDLYVLKAHETLCIWDNRNHRWNSLHQCSVLSHAHENVINHADTTCAWPRYANLKHQPKLNFQAWQTRAFNLRTWKKGNDKILVFFLKKNHINLHFCQLQPETKTEEVCFVVVLPYGFVWVHGCLCQMYGIWVSNSILYF